MQDLEYLLVIVVFFAVAALFVIGCDRIIGPDSEAISHPGVAPQAEATEAGEAERV